MGKIKEFAEMDGYTETQLLMCEKEDLIEYIKYLRTITAEEEAKMLTKNDLSLKNDEYF